MPFARSLGLTALLLLTAGCTHGYWDDRLAELPRSQNFGCRDGLATGVRVNAALYCPRDMPLPPNDVWRPGLTR
jgi:hypothetical protein